MFRTEINIDAFPVKIKLKNQILTTGSCFSDAIGNQLKKNKFNTLVNPFGTNYNPHSIHQSLQYAIRRETVPSHSFVENQGIHLNYNFHSSFSSVDQTETKKIIEKVIENTHHSLKQAQWIFITYGTAWVYERIDTKEIVANCHKIPANQFSKSLLSQKKVLESFDSLYSDLKKFNSNGKIILTVSPVRHLKDTLPFNNVSKSVLRLACHTLTEKYNDVYYFPSYEIMMDDLRDYRFYKSDMIHPSDEAEEYIWNKFADCCFDDETKAFLKKWKSIQTAVNHKPFHPLSESHQRFLKHTLTELRAIQSITNVDDEIRFVQSQIKSS